MRLFLYSVFDVQLKVHLAPFAGRGDVEAVRQVRATLENPQMVNSPLVMAPHDYELVRVCEFDDETGICSGSREFVSSVKTISDSLSKRGGTVTP